MDRKLLFVALALAMDRSFKGPEDESLPHTDLPERPILVLGDRGIVERMLIEHELRTELAQHMPAVIVALDVPGTMKRHINDVPLLTFPFLPRNDDPFRDGRVLPARSLGPGKRFARPHRRLHK